jgi:hypothetical protein
MPDPTREQAIDACTRAASWDEEIGNPTPTSRLLSHAASLLARDGKLRERLEKLAASWRHEQGGEPREFCLVRYASEMVAAPVKYGCEAYRGPTCDACKAMDAAAEELEAALKEDEK